jgi:virginiamycin A acetyltransferase
MNISTEIDCCGFDEHNPLAEKFTILKSLDGTFSMIPNGFFRDWLDQDVMKTHAGSFHIGKCSGLGVGSVAKYDGAVQSLKVGRYVSGGLRLKFLLNGQHETKTISTYMFSVLNNGIFNVAPPQYKNTVIKNDVWIGDEALFLGGSVIENGCVIGARTVVPPNFETEPFGVYAGSPARLIKFRFSDKVREALVALAWWELPLEWVKLHNSGFLENMNEDEHRSLEIIEILRESSLSFVRY